MTAHTDKSPYFLHNCKGSIGSNLRLSSAIKPQKLGHKNKRCDVMQGQTPYPCCTLSHFANPHLRILLTASTKAYYNNVIAYCSLV